MKAEGVPGKQRGANISVMGVLAASGNLKDSTEWQYVELYGKTGPNQNSITVACRLGGYGEESTGKAMFDDISLHGLSGNPLGKNVQLLFDRTPPERRPKKFNLKQVSVQIQLKKSYQKGFVSISSNLLDTSEMETDEIRKAVEEAKKRQNQEKKGRWLH